MNTHSKGKKEKKIARVPDQPAPSNSVDLQNWELLGKGELYETGFPFSCAIVY